MNILICGSDLSGKTTFAEKLFYYENDKFLYYKDTDIEASRGDLSFSEVTDFVKSYCTQINKHCIVDFKAPTDEDKSGYDMVIWIDTLEENDVDFVEPTNADYTLNTFEDTSLIVESIIGEING